MSNDISFSNINKHLIGNSKSLLEGWLPGGTLKGNEFEALNPTRQDSSPGSFKVNVQTGKWSDFATGDTGGDLISLYAYLNEGISQSEAASRLADRLPLEGLHGPDI
jgi:putative DNA primase/helicase